METPHDLIEIAVVTVVALLCGLGLSRLRQPPIVGYILAGVLLGPSMAGLVENRETVALLAELGVLTLLFLLGMELSLRSFKAVWRVVMLGAALQLVACLGLAWAVSMLLGWPLDRAVLLGFIFTLSSTAVAIKILEDIDELRSHVGRIAVGVLVAQDLAVVPMLLLVNGMGNPEGMDLTVIPLILGAVGGLGGLVWFLSRRQRVQLPFADKLENNHDLPPLAALTLCFAAATISGLIGLSAAYGAFLAGLVIGNSSSRTVMVHAMQPIQSVLMMAFFLSVGLLIDVNFLFENIGTVLLLLFIVTLVKTVINVTVLSLAGEPWERSFLSGVVLGQIGEFSFVLAAAGVASGVIDTDFRDLAVAVIALSLIISPIWLYIARHFGAFATEGLRNLRTELRLLSNHEVSTLDAVLSCQPNDLPRLFLVLFRRTGRSLRDLPHDIAEHAGFGRDREEGAEKTETEPADEAGPAGARSKPAE